MMEEVDEQLEEGDDIESLEDLQGEEEKEDKKVIAEREFRNNYPEIYLNDSQVIKEKRIDFCSTRIVMKPSQIKLISFVQQDSGIKTRSEFIRYAVLSYARDRMKIINAKREADIQFTKDFKILRTKILMKQNQVEEKMKKLKKLSSQDKGGVPFTVDDLME